MERQPTRPGGGTPWRMRPHARCCFRLGDQAVGDGCGVHGVLPDHATRPRLDPSTMRRVATRPSLLRAQCVCQSRLRADELVYRICQAQQCLLGGRKADRFRPGLQRV